MTAVVVRIIALVLGVRDKTLKRTRKYFSHRRRIVESEVNKQNQKHQERSGLKNQMLASTTLIGKNIYKMKRWIEIGYLRK